MLKLWPKVSRIFLMFQRFKSQISQLTKMDITRFAMKFKAALEDY